MLITRGDHQSGQGSGHRYGHRCTSTVSGVTYSSCAIARLVRPAAARLQVLDGLQRAEAAAICVALDGL
jgi:hypothetical protein